MGLQQSVSADPAQQIAPASQHTLMLVPLFSEVQTRPAAQHVPSALHMPEQHWLSVAQPLPPLVQQEPAVQVCPAWHALPQAPQLPASVAVFVHTPLHLV